MAIFGNNSEATGSSDAVYANSKIATKATLTETGLVSKLSLWCFNGASDPISVRSGIYTNHASVYPLNLVAGTGGTAVVAGSQTLQWKDITFATPVELTAGTYWLAVQADSYGDQLAIHYSTVAASGAWIADTYSDGIGSTWGGSTTNSVYTQLYATYTAGGGGFTGLTVIRDVSS